MPSPEPTTLPAGVTLTGDLHTPGDALIAGHVTGDLQVQGRVTLASTARIDGAIVAHQAALHGHAGSDVSIHGLTELFPGAQVRGVLSTQEISAHHGARFEGRLVLDPRAQADAAHASQIDTASTPAPAAPSPAASHHAAPTPSPAQTPTPAKTPASAPSTVLPFIAVPGAASAGLRLRAPAG